ncbi:hypothetical protein ACQBAU_10625 [Propionibacteriaceae bacterium Y2011]
MSPRPEERGPDHEDDDDLATGGRYGTWIGVVAIIAIIALIAVFVVQPFLG